jgi:hypothetical protein
MDETKPCLVPAGRQVKYTTSAQTIICRPDGAYLNNTHPQPPGSNPSLIPDIPNGIFDGLLGFIITAGFKPVANT